MVKYSLPFFRESNCLWQVWKSWVLWMTLITIFIFVILLFRSKQNFDPIPICPECGIGTVRIFRDSSYIKVEAPLVYDGRGNLILAKSYVKIQKWFCNECGTTYSWFESEYYGEGYYEHGMLFKVDVKFDPNNR